MTDTRSPGPLSDSGTTTTRLPSGDMLSRLAFAADSISAAVYHNEDASEPEEMAEWFRVGFLVEVAKEIRAAVSRLRDLEAREAAAAKILQAIIDDEPCHLDHHGGCQEHSDLGGDVCYNKRGRDWLAASSRQSPSPEKPNAS